MAKDKDYRRLINTARWRALRRRVLSEQPLCERCAAEGYVCAAEEVHHITPVEYAPDYAGKLLLMFSRNNLRALCHACHVKEHIEMGRSGRAATQRRNEVQMQMAIDKLFGDDKSKGGGLFFKTPPGCP